MTLSPWESWVEEAFARLCRDRPIGFGGVGPIPWRSLEDYMDRRGVRDPIMRQRIETLVIKLDAYDLGAMRGG